MTSNRDCEHGQLARSCEICELQADLACAVAFLRAYRDQGAPGRIGRTLLDEFLADHPWDAERLVAKRKGIECLSGS